MPNWKKLIVSGSSPALASVTASVGLTTPALTLNGTAVTSTAAEINLIDGGTSRGTTAVANGDGFLHNDGGTMRMTNVKKLADLFAGTNLTATNSVIAVDDAFLKNDANDSTSGTITAAGFTTTGNISGSISQAVQASITTAANLTTVGTISSGTWQGTAIASGYIAADAITGAKIADDAIDSEHYTDGSIDTAHLGDDQVTYAKIQNVSATNRILGRDSSGAGVIEEISPADLRTMINVENGATADQSQSDINSLAITTVGTISSGTWQGTAIASGYIAADAITGAKIADDAIDSEHYAAGSIDNEHLADDAVGADELASSAVVNASFASDAKTYISGAIDAATGSYVGTSNVTTLGTIGTGTWNGTAIASAYLDSDTAHLSGTQTFTGAKSFDENATLAGFVLDGNTITGIDDSGEFTDDDAHIMTSAGINDRFSLIAGSSNITTVGTISSGTWQGTAIASGYIAADAITGAKIADDAIDSEHYTDGSIDTAHLGDDQVTYAKIQNVSATNRILGRDSSGAGVIEEISPSSLRTMINVEDGATADQSQSDINGLAITTVGTISSGTWQGTAIASGYIAADAITGAKIADDAVDSEHYTDGSIDTAHIGDDQVTYAKIQNVSATDRILGRDSSGAGVIEEISPSSLRTMINVEDGATADQTKADINALDITEVGTIDSGVWNGTAIASAYLDSDTAHLSTAQTFTGAKTFGTTNKLLFRDSAIYLNSSTDGQLDIVADTEIQIAATTIDINGAADISGNLTVGGTFTVNGGVTFVSSSQVDIGDRIIELNSNAAAGDGGLYVRDASGNETGSLLWDVSANRWIGGVKDSEVTIPTISSTDTLTNKTIAISQVTELSNLTAAEGAQLENIGSTTISAAQWGYLGAAGNTLVTTDGSQTLSNKTIAASQVTEISNITAGEGAQIENINSVTISNTQWGYLGALDQTVITTADVAFNSLDIAGDADIDGTLEADAITVGGTALNTVIAGVTVTNATTAAVATTVTITDNESTNEDNAIIFTAGGDVDGGNLGLESDGDLTYNPSTGTVTATIFKGNIDAVDGDFDGTLEADAITVGGTALNTVIAGVTVTNATNAAHTYITDNESTDEENQITFIEGAGGGGANRGLEADGDLTYNPSTGTVSATIFKGNIDAVDGDFDGTLEADAITVGGTALNTVIAGVTVTNATNAAHVLVTDNESTNEDNAVTFVEGATKNASGNVGLESDGTFTYNPSTGTVTATNFSGNLTGTLQTAAQTNITSVGTIGTGVWQGTAIASAYLDSDTAHLSGTQTFSGAKTFSSEATFTAGIQLNDSDIITIGTGGDYEILDDGTDTLFRGRRHAGLAYFQMENDGGTLQNAIVLGSSGSNQDVAVELRYNNVARIWTTSDGTAFKGTQHTFMGNTVVGSGGEGSFYVGNVITTNDTDKGLRIHTNNDDVYFDYNFGGNAAAGQWHYLRQYDTDDTDIHTRFGFEVGTGKFAASSDITAYYSFSDKRLKTNIKPIDNGLDQILNLNPVEYEWKTGDRVGKKEIGLIAQEVEKVVPEVIRENKRLDDDTFYKQIDYDHLVPLLINSVKELKTEIEELKQKLKEK